MAKWYATDPLDTEDTTDEKRRGQSRYWSQSNRDEIEVLRTCI